MSSLASPTSLGVEECNGSSGQLRGYRSSRRGRLRLCGRPLQRAGVGYTSPYRQADGRPGPGGVPVRRRVEERRPDRSRLCRGGPAAPLGNLGTGSENGRQPVRRRTGSWSDQVALNSDHGIAPTRLASGVASCAQARDAEDGREKSSSAEGSSDANSCLTRAPANRSVLAYAPPSPPTSCQTWTAIRHETNPSSLNQPITAGCQRSREPSCG